MDRKIDVYVDFYNNHNVWAIIHYKGNDGKKHDEFIRFENYYAASRFVDGNFEPKNVTIHSVDYSQIVYYFYDNQPEYNYIEVVYDEIVEGRRREKRIELPHEYENVFIEILKINKRIPQGVNLDSRYYRDVDVHKKRKEDKEAKRRSIKMSISEFLSLAGDRIKYIKSNKKIVSGLKKGVALVVLASILQSGYTLVDKNELNAEYLVQTNPIRSAQDVGIYVNKGKIGIIIEKLMNGQYNEVSPDEIREVIEFIQKVENSNYDNNDSHNAFSYNEYFDHKMMMHGNYSNKAYEVIEKIGSLYNNCFVLNNGKYTLKSSNVKAYLDYLASLTCVYDTYHDTRPSTIKTNNQGVATPYANIDEIRAYDSLPPILRYIILNQLRGILSRSDYKMDILPSYSFDFDGVDKNDLMQIVHQKLSNVVEILYQDCCRKDGNKSI